MEASFKEGLGQRIRSLRKRLGLSQEALASKMDFGSSEIISKIELGQRDVKAWELANLAKILVVDLSALLGAADAQTEAEVLLWRELPKSDKEAKEAAFLKHCHEYSLVEELSDRRRDDPFPERDVDPDKVGFREAAKIAEEIRKAFNLGDRPAASLEKTLQNRYGVKVWYEDLDEGSAASILGSFGPAILMNSREAPWRRNYNFAHEVFHLITWKSLPPTSLIKNKQLWEKVEKIANSFASCLLLPADVVLEEVRDRIVDGQVEYIDLVGIARSFEISTDALMYRLVNLGFFKRDDVESLLDDEGFRKLDKSTMKEHWWDPPAFPERFVRLAFLACQKGKLSKAKLAQLLDTSLFDLTGRLEEYGLDDRESYNVQVRTA